MKKLSNTNEGLSYVGYFNCTFTGIGVVGSGSLERISPGTTETEPLSGG
jgi:hypothetical protein